VHLLHAIKAMRCLIKLTSEWFDCADTVENGQYFYADYSISAGSLKATVVTDGYTGMASKKLETIRLLGASGVSSVTVNGSPHSSFTTLPSGEVSVTNLGLAANSAFTIVFA